MASILFPRLYRTRIWHCVGGGGVCHPVGPSSTKWNGIVYKPSSASASGEASGEAAAAPRGQLYVNDIFRRITVEFDVIGTGVATRLLQRRTFRHRHLVDNPRLDSTGQALWVGVVGHSKPNLDQGVAALQANATRAHAALDCEWLPEAAPGRDAAVSLLDRLDADALQRSRPAPNPSPDPQP